MDERIKDVVGTPGDDATERELDKLEAKAMLQLLEALPKYMKEVEWAYISQDRVRSLAPVISFFSIRRQERVLKGIKKQSDAMRKHSRCMKVMTAAILLATLVQVVLLVLRK